MVQAKPDGKAQRENKEIDAMSFENALEELEKIVEQLERGNESLADGVALYERGVALKTHCESLLKEAQMKIETIEKRAGSAMQGSDRGAKDSIEDDIPF